jgi:hypothetical protein
MYKSKKKKKHTSRPEVCMSEVCVLPPSVHVSGYINNNLKKKSQALIGRVPGLPPPMDVVRQVVEGHQVVEGPQMDTE